MSLRSLAEQAQEGARGFRGFLKPRLAEILDQVGLAVAYDEADGNYMYFTCADGGRTQVLDMLGGYGAALLGHNHPELVHRAREVLETKRPFHAQASMRLLAGRLAERLSERVGRATGRAYRVTLAATGTEAVEAAIKHAEMELVARAERIQEELARTRKEFRARARRGEAHVPVDTLRQAERLMGVEPLLGADDLFQRVANYNREFFEKRPLFLALERAFHGKSSGALSLTANEEYREPWRRMGLRCTFLNPEDEEALRAEVNGSLMRVLELRLGPSGDLALSESSLCNVAALFVEPIQGEGGVREVPLSFLRVARELATHHGFPLVLDEIQCGMGRTGTFLASEPSGIVGDYCTLSKSLGGGLVKIAALLVDNTRAIDRFGLLHTSTFADDDFSSAVALGVLEILDRDGGALVRECAEKGSVLRSKLEALQQRYPDQLREIRGRGLMLGLELASQETSPSTFLRILSEQGLLGYVFAGYMLHAEGIRVMPTLSAPETIRIQPSVFLPEEAMDRFVGAVERFLQAVQRCDTERLAFFLAGKDAAPPPRGEGAAQGRVEVLDVPVVRGAVPVCFLGHFLDADDVRSWDPGFGSFSQGECRTFVQKTKGLVNPFVAHTAALQSQQGTLVHLTVVGIPFSSEQVMDSFQGGNLGWARELIDDALVMAQDRGAKMVGFGGYTSIVTDNCRAVPADTFAVTSGNSLTSAAAVEAVKQAKARLGLRSLRLGVVGALGNIGAVLAELLAEEVDSVVLVGRPGAERRLAVREGELYAQALLRLADQGQDQGLGRRLATSTLGRAFLASHRGDVPVSGAEEAPLLTFLLEGMMNAALVDAIRKAIAQGGDGLGALVRSEMGYQAPITVATDMAALRSCNVILAATNAPRPVILPEHVGEGPVVLCDVAAPGDVHPDVARQRPEAIVLKGGMVRLPLRQTLRIPGMPLSDGEVYGCLGETILCGFAGLDEGLSVGKLTTEGVRRARDLALHHGFSFGEKFARTSSAEEPQGASSTAVKP